MFAQRHEARIWRPMERGGGDLLLQSGNSGQSYDPTHKEITAWVVAMVSAGVWF